MSEIENPPAFPVIAENGLGHVSDGMTLRDYFAGQALGNNSICTGTATDRQLVAWFGRTRTDITRAEISARQAFDYADAMLAAQTPSVSS